MAMIVSNLRLEIGLGPAKMKHLDGTELALKPTMSTYVMIFY